MKFYKNDFPYAQKVVSTWGKLRVNFPNWETRWIVGWKVVFDSEKGEAVEQLTERGDLLADVVNTSIEGSI